MVGQIQSTTPRYGAIITTVDPAQGIVEGVLKSGSAIRISVYTTGVAFRWPVVGEAWMVRQENGNWYLEGLWPSSTFQSVNAGDAIINSPTGTVHVMGTPDGAGDFIINHTGWSDLLRASHNLSDLANVVTARTNLGLGTAATQPITAFLQKANNLSDLGNVSAARANIGLSAPFRCYINSLTGMSGITSNTWTIQYAASGTPWTVDFDPDNAKGGTLPEYTIPRNGYYRFFVQFQVAAASSPTSVGAGLAVWNGSAWVFDRGTSTWTPTSFGTVDCLHVSTRLCTAGTLMLPCIFTNQATVHLASPAYSSNFFEVQQIG